MRQQASSAHCFVCGVRNNAGLKMRFYESDVEPLVVTAEYNVPAHYQGYPGVVHGGIIASMLDEVTSRVVFRGDPPRFAVTASLNIRYRKPVPVETLLRLTGRIVKQKGRVITVAGQLIGPGDLVLAEAEAVLVEVDTSYFGEALDGQEWQVYPDSMYE